MVSLELSGFPQFTSKIAAMERAIEVSPRRVANRSALLLKRFLRDSVPGRTGATQRSIRFEVRGSDTAATASFYALRFPTVWIIEGTRPHDIWAGFYTGKSSKMALYWPGARHPVKSVHHPGTKANDFRRPAFGRLAEEIGLVLSEEAPRILRGDTST